MGGYYVAESTLLEGWGMRVCCWRDGGCEYGTEGWVARVRCWRDGWRECVTGVHGIRGHRKAKSIVMMIRVTMVGGDGKADHEGGCCALMIELTSSQWQHETLLTVATRDTAHSGNTRH